MCPEEPKCKGFSSLLWGSLQDTDTLVFLRTAGGKLCVTPEAQRDIIVLGTLSLSKKLSLTLKVRTETLAMLKMELRGERPPACSPDLAFSERRENSMPVA